MRRAAPWAGKVALFLFALLCGATAILFLRPAAVTLDLTASTEAVTIGLADADVSREPHRLELRNAVICGGPNPLADASNHCGRRTEIAESFTGRLTISEGSSITFEAHGTGVPTIITIRNSTSVGGLVWSELGASSEPLPDVARIYLDSPTDLSDATLFPFRAVGFSLGGAGRDWSSMSPPILQQGRATIIDRGLLGDRILVGDPIEFSLGDIIRFCPSGNDVRQPICGDAIGLIALTSNTIQFSARVPLPGVFVSKFGTEGYTIGLAWWQRFALEPTVVLIWFLLGAFYFGLSLREKIGAGRSTSRGGS